MGFVLAELDIPLHEHASMFPEWHPPGHWSLERRNAHQRSMSFLESIVNQSDGMEFIERRGRFPKILVKGTSRRWYLVELSYLYTEQFLDDYGVVEEVIWRTGVVAGAWKQDVTKESGHSVSVCIGTRRNSRDLPIGDQVGSLVLSLRSDRKTAMRIPLLAQFIVSPRDALKDVYQFSEEGVIMEEEVFMMHEFDEIQHEVEDAAQAEEEFPFECIANMVEILDSAEGEAFDRWVSEREDELMTEAHAEPWQHDREEIL